MIIPYYFRLQPEQPRPIIYLMQMFREITARLVQRTKGIRQIETADIQKELMAARKSS